MQLTIFNHAKIAPVPKKRLTLVCAQIARTHNVSASTTVTLVLCDHVLIRRLNRRYRCINRVTDVLSFTFDDPDLLGEIYICTSRAVQQARDYGHSYAIELQRLLVHGMFHLLGYDHKTVAQRRVMESHEVQFCTVPWATRRKS